jgi:type IV pilus assembly protein PilB
MKFDDETIKKILLEEGYASEEDVKKAEIYAKDHGSSFTEYFIVEGLLTKEIITQAIAESIDMPYLNLKASIPTKDEVLRIPEEIGLKFRVVMVEEKEDSVIVVTDKKPEAGVTEELNKIFPGKKIIISLSSSEEIDEAFIFYQKGLETRFEKIIESKKQIAPEIVDQIFQDALSLKASDIHCEPWEKEVVIRFRIDGVLQEAGRVPKEYYDMIVNRIKVQAKLRIDEHFGSQDGAIRYTVLSTGESVDLRVSIIPTLDGEKIVIRVLSNYVRNLTLSNIGLSDELQKEIVRSSKKPFGMILVTGPTGSGKSTTLYSLMKVVNTRHVNITTIEDPVEYKIEGINQIQVNPQSNLTFARGLRAITRQDPNVILVGEIRDTETADIAVNAALTGHLLLSTFHANNATTAIPRLVDMGIEPYLLSSTLELIISQRLVRKICNSCKVSYEVNESYFEKFGKDVKSYFTDGGVTLYKGKGCEACSNTGFSGRIGIFEFLKTSQELQELIPENPTTNEIFKLVRKQGFKTFFEDGLDKVKSGLTTLEELLRIANPQ